MDRAELLSWIHKARAFLAKLAYREHCPTSTGKATDWCGTCRETVEYCDKLTRPCNGKTARKLLT